MAAQVEGHGAVVAAEFLELAVPAVPELGEAVDEEHQRGVGSALLDAVQLDAAGQVCVEMLHAQSLKIGSRFCMLAAPASNRSCDISIAAFQVAT